MALTLRTVCGLSVADVARVLLLGEDAAAKRLVRTRQKIARAGIPYRVPADADLPARLRAVAAVVHLVFTAGYAGAPEAELVRVDLCAEAIRLARLLDDLLPGEATLQGLLALHAADARAAGRPARRARRTSCCSPIRTAAAGTRTRSTRDSGCWRRACVAATGSADRYQLEAAIASCHVAPADVDRPEVLRLYDLLLEVAPSRSVAVNRAVALAEAHGTGGRAAGARRVGRPTRATASRVARPARRARRPAAPAGPARRRRCRLPAGARLPTDGTGATVSDEPSRAGGPAATCRRNLPRCCRTRSPP